MVRGVPVNIRCNFVVSYLGVYFYNKKLKLLKNCTIISLPKLMATHVKRGKSSTILHVVKPLIYRLEN